MRDVVERQRQQEQKKAAEAAAHAAALSSKASGGPDKAQRRRSTAHMHSNAPLSRHRSMAVNGGHERSENESPLEGIEGTESVRSNTPQQQQQQQHDKEGPSSPIPDPNLDGSLAVTPTKRPKLLQRRKSSLM